MSPCLAAHGGAVMVWLRWFSFGSCVLFAQQRRPQPLAAPRPAIPVAANASTHTHTHTPAHLGRVQHRAARQAARRRARALGGEQLLGVGLLVEDVAAGLLMFVVMVVMVVAVVVVGCELL